MKEKTANQKHKRHYFHKSFLSFLFSSKIVFLRANLGYRTFPIDLSYLSLSTLNLFSFKIDPSSDHPMHSLFFDLIDFYTCSFNIFFSFFLHKANFDFDIKCKKLRCYYVSVFSNSITKLK